MKKWVIGNWKLQGSRSFLRSYFAEFAESAQASAEKFLAGGVQLAICPPASYLSEAVSVIADLSEPWSERVLIGAQNIAEYGEGAYTGEVAADMVKDCGAAIALVGHSERRQLFGETDAQVAQKMRQAFAAELVPVLCVGETLQERESERTLPIIEQQLKQACANLSSDQWARLVIAYEPVWAIGTGLTATPEQAQEVHAFIRAQCAQMQSRSVVRVPLLYGGSVKGGNAQSLLTQVDVDGVLVGGASLKASEFAQILAASWG
jgi:triosephosphate isomerase